MNRLLILMACLIATTLDAKPTERITRAEPLSWWTDMRMPLQIMFYGADIAGATVSCAQPGLRVVAVHAAESPDYLFVDVEVHAAGDYRFDFQRGRQRWSHPYRIDERRAGSAERAGFGPADVMYLLMPDRFANGDTANDTTPHTAEAADRSDPDGRHGGDIQGIIDRLDYLADLGVTALWSTPLLLDDQPSVSYHGYACADYYRIDPRYGSNELYREMVAQAHARGIKVIMDVVTNHCGTAHPWMADPPFAEWLHRPAAYTPTNHAMNALADPHAAAAEREGFASGWFDRSMPDIDLRNPFVLKYFEQWAAWWIEWADLDGLRVDTWPYNALEPMTRWGRTLLEEYPRLNIVGECWYPTPLLLSWWEERVPTLMDFPLHVAIGEALAPDTIAWGQGLKRVYDVVSQDFAYDHPERMMLLLENHDTDRIAHVLGGNTRKMMLATTLLATLRGMPQWYAGAEVMLPGAKASGDGAMRVDFPGGWPDDAIDLFSPADRSEDQRVVFDHARTLFRWRKGCEAVHEGKLLHYMPLGLENVYVYFRYTDRRRVMVVVNASPEPYRVDWQRFEEGIAGRTSGTDILTGRPITIGQELEVPAVGSMVIEM